MANASGHVRPNPRKPPGRTPKQLEARAPLTLAELESMLHAAGAAGPYRQVDLRILQTWCHVAGAKAVLPTDNTRRNAARAAATLRLALVKMAAEDELVQGWPALSRHPLRAAEYRAALVAINLAFPPSAAPPRRKPDAARWHEPALNMFVGYRNAVGKASVSRNGPAVRFVKAALQRIGYGLITGPAIEGCLTRFRTLHGFPEPLDDKPQSVFEKRLTGTT